MLKTFDWMQEIIKWIQQLTVKDLQNFLKITILGRKKHCELTMYGAVHDLVLHISNLCQCKQYKMDHIWKSVKRLNSVEEITIINPPPNNVINNKKNKSICNLSVTIWQKK